LLGRNVAHCKLDEIKKGATLPGAGYSTGATLVSAFSAYIMINGTSLPLFEMLAWVFVLAVLGVTMAIPP